MALIATLGGVGMLAMFAAVHNSRRNWEIKRFRRALQKRPLLTDAEFCAAISNCDPELLVAYRNLLGEYLGVPPSSLRPEDDLRVSDDLIASGLVYSLERAAQAPFARVQRAVHEDRDEALSELECGTLCKDEARTFCRVMEAYRRVVSAAS